MSYCRGGEGRAEAGAAAVEALCLQTAGGAGRRVISPWTSPQQLSREKE